MPVTFVPLLLMIPLSSGEISHLNYALSHTMAMDHCNALGYKLIELHTQQSVDDLVAYATASKDNSFKHDN